jgi:hypothetical protein
LIFYDLLFLQPEHPAYGNNKKQACVVAGEVADDPLCSGDDPFQSCPILDDGEEGAVVQLPVGQEIAQARHKRPIIPNTYLVSAQPRTLQDRDTRYTHRFPGVQNVSTLTSITENGHNQIKQDIFPNVMRHQRSTALVSALETNCATLRGPLMWPEPPSRLPPKKYPNQSNPL